MSSLEKDRFVHRLFRTWIFRAVLALAAIATTTASSFAQRPGALSILPHYTLAAARIADVPLLAERFQQTAIGRVSQDPQMKPLVGDIFKAFQDAFRPIESQIGLPLDQLLKIPQ